MNLSQTPPVGTAMVLRDHLARGAVRDVWHHPYRPDLVVKTIRSRKREGYARRAGTLRGRWDVFAYGPYRTFLVEYRTYLRLAAAAERMGYPNPVAEVGGIVPTDHGLGQLCRKVGDGQGGVGWTLRRILDAGTMTPHLVARLNALVGEIDAVDASLPDLQASNVVFDAAADRFVVVDGFGEKSLVPLREWVPALRRRRLDRWLESLGRRRALQWNGRERRYALSDMIQPPPKTRVPSRS